MTRICHMEKNFQLFFLFLFLFGSVRFFSQFVTLKWHQSEACCRRVCDCVCRVYRACISMASDQKRPQAATKITRHCAKCTLRAREKTNGFCCCDFIYVRLFGLAVWRRCCNACAHADATMTHLMWQPMARDCITHGLVAEHQIEVHAYCASPFERNGIRQYLFLDFFCFRFCFMQFRTLFCDAASQCEKNRLHRRSQTLNERTKTRICNKWRAHAIRTPRSTRRARTYKKCHMSFIRRMSSRMPSVLCVCDLCRCNRRCCCCFWSWKPFKPTSVNIELNQNKWKWICFSCLLLFNVFLFLNSSALKTLSSIIRAHLSLRRFICSKNNHIRDYL